MISHDRCSRRLDSPNWVLKGRTISPLTTVLLVNLSLLGLFAVQHSVMPRPTFKRWWSRRVRHGDLWPRLETIMKPRDTLSHARRIGLIALGSLCVGLGTVGIFVPGLPTTVFLLVASWCFARSSERLWRKLHANRRLGAYLRMASQRSLPVRARVISLVGIWGGITLAIAAGGVTAPWLVTVLVLAGVVGTGFVVTMRRRPPATAAVPTSSA